MRELKFGVEIEFFGVSVDTVIRALRNNDIDVADFNGYTHEVMPQWKVTTDASVNSTGTNERRGLELVSPILYEDEGLDELERVYNTLESIGAKVDKTCGTHIHFDIADFTAHHVRNAVTLYHNYQSVINYILPKSRRGNSFCKSILSRNVEDMYERGESLTIETISRILGTRYKVINLDCYVKYGTIEFRQHSGTVEFEKIEAWIVFLYKVLDYAKNQTEMIYPSKESDAKKNLNYLLEKLDLTNTETSEFITNRFSHFKEAN